MTPSHSLQPFAYRQAKAHGIAAGLVGLLMSDRRLQIGLGLSLLLHLFLLSVHFGLPEREDAVLPNRALDVVLVNARHAQAPEQADVLAQANLDGGGTTELDTRPTTPLPPQEQPRQDGDALVEARATPPEPRPVQQEVLTRPTPAERPAPRVTPAPPQPTPPKDPEPAPASGVDLMNSIAAVARMEAQIDRNLNEYAKRPRKAFIGARTREYRFAQYVEDWRQKIERVGTLNYPEAARGRLYGSLLLSVVIRADGSIERVEVHRSSGQKVLDDAAVRIVELAAPFAPFPPNIRVDTDLIEITRTWTFTNSDQLRTR